MVQMTLTLYGVLILPLKLYDFVLIEEKAGFNSTLCLKLFARI